MQDWTYLTASRNGLPEGKPQPRATHIDRAALNIRAQLVTSRNGFANQLRGMLKALLSEVEGLFGLRMGQKMVRAGGFNLCLFIRGFFIRARQAMDPRSSRG